MLIPGMVIFFTSTSNTQTLHKPVVFQVTSSFEKDPESIKGYNDTFSLTSAFLEPYSNNMVVDKDRRELVLNNVNSDQVDTP